MPHKHMLEGFTGCVNMRESFRKELAVWV